MIEIGADTVITNNGGKTQYGGGIRNYGEITVSAGAQLYNNHALMAGDDIYNGTYKYKTYTCDGKITFGTWSVTAGFWMTAKKSTRS